MQCFLYRCLSVLAGCLVITGMVGASADGGTDGKKIAHELEAQLKTLSGEHVEVMQAFYNARAYAPGWVGGEGRTSLARDLLRRICRCYREGFSAAAYDLPGVAEELKAVLLEPAKDGSDRAEHLAALELSFSRLFLNYADDLLNGRVAPEEVNGQWYLFRRTVPLRPVLEETIEHRSLETLQEKVDDQPGYEEMRAAYNRYRKARSEGTWRMVPDERPLRVGTVSPAVYALKKRLQAGEVLGADVPMDFVFGPALKRSVVRFQQRYGLEPDGIVAEPEFRALNVPVEQRLKQLAVNMERIRWTPERLGAERIIVNIPDFQLYGYEEGRLVLEMPVIVGQVMHKTPVFADTLSYVVIRPYWNVPSSIAIDELMPDIRQPGFLAASNYEVVNDRYEPVSSDRLAKMSPQKLKQHFRRYEMIVRQKPGDHNALGLIKFKFPNAFNIYLHDTPADRMFSYAERDFSHGCIRVQRPAELADLVLEDKWTIERIRKQMHGGEDSRKIPVREENRWPVYMLYRTAWVDVHGAVNFRQDIYNHDTTLSEALGGPPNETDTQICRSLQRISDTSMRPRTEP